MHGGEPGCFPRDAGFASRGMLALPPALISRKLLRGGAACHGVTPSSGCLGWMEVVIPSQGFYFFFHASLCRVYGPCVSGPPPPCHRLCRDEVSLFARSWWCCGEREEPCSHRNRRDESLEQGRHVQGCSGYLWGPEQPLQGNGVLAEGPSSEVCVLRIETALRLPVCCGVLGSRC